MTTIIDVQEVTKRFGNVLAVDRCSLKVEKGSITGLIGPNGAGKTTMFNMVAGAFAPTSGKILLDGEDVTGLPAHELFSRGLLRTFQIAQEFSTMTALENLLMGPVGRERLQRLVPARQGAGGRDRHATARRGRHRRASARPCQERAGREPLRRAEEAAGAWPRDDGQPARRAAGRDRGGRQPHAFE